MSLALCGLALFWIALDCDGVVLPLACPSATCLAARVRTAAADPCALCPNSEIQLRCQASYLQSIRLTGTRILDLGFGVCSAPVQ